MFTFNNSYGTNLQVRNVPVIKCKAPIWLWTNLNSVSWMMKVWQKQIQKMNICILYLSPSLSPEQIQKIHYWLMQLMTCLLWLIIEASTHFMSYYMYVQLNEVKNLCEPKLNLTDKKQYTGLLSQKKVKRMLKWWQNEFCIFFSSMLNLPLQTSMRVWWVCTADKKNQTYKV